MARLDLYRLAGLDGYVLEVQADLLAILATAVVVPLLPLEQAPKPISRLNPVFEIGKRPYVMVTQSIAAVPRAELGQAAGALENGRHFEVVNALDMLLSGI